MLVASDCMILFLTTSENALEKLLTQISGRKILVRKFIFGIAPENAEPLLNLDMES